MINIKRMEIPFSNFQPNTVISSSQANDNFYEIQYKFNLLVESGIMEIGSELDKILKQVTVNTDDILKLRSDVNEFTQITNTKLDQLTIATNDIREQNDRLQVDFAEFKNSIVLRLSVLESNMSEVLKTKADGLSYDGSNLILTAQEVEVDRVDIANLINVPSSNPPFKMFNVSKDQWAFDPIVDLYILNLKHDFKTTELLVSEKIDGYTNFVSYRATDSNSITLHNESPEDMKVTVCVIDNKWENSDVDPLALIDDLLTVADKTWSSLKINTELKALSDKIDNLPSGGVQIDDTVSVTDKTWSSSKISSEIANSTSGKTEIDDTATTSTSTWSSTKINFDIGTTLASAKTYTDTEVGKTNVKVASNTSESVRLNSEVEALKTQVGQARIDLITETNKNINI